MGKLIAATMLCVCGRCWWLWLTLVFISVSMVNCADCTERHHHNHNHHHHHHNHHFKHATRHTTQSDTLSSSQLEKIPSLPLADMAEPGDSCPNCVLPEQKREKAPQQQTSDELRLETIKRQILSKLGLKEKPNVTSPVPREVIMETLNRADEMLEQQDGSGNHHVMYDDDSAIPSSTRPPESEPDDFYGRTSEIIAFAEPGRNASCPVSEGTQYVPLETPFIYVYSLLFLLCNSNYHSSLWL